MSDNPTEPHAHDPEPFVTYTMQTGSAGGWRGKARFAPRPGYCQDPACYRAAREAKNATE